MIHLVAMILLQQATAEETLRLLEESLGKAKSVSIRVRQELAMGDQKATRTVTVLLKTGNKIKITADISNGSSAMCLSDGMLVRSSQKDSKVDRTRDYATPKTLRKDVTVALVRAGCLDLPTLPDRIESSGKNPSEDLILKDVKFGEKEGDLQILTYTLQEGKGSAEMKLWVDVKGSTLKKRTYSVPAARATVIETYDEFLLNADIPDTTFQLPKK